MQRHYSDLPIQQHQQCAGVPCLLCPQPAGPDDPPSSSERRLWLRPCEPALAPLQLMPRPCLQPWHVVGALKMPKEKEVQAI